MSDCKSEDKLAAARAQAMAQYASISEMVAKLRAAENDDAYEEMAAELAKEAGFSLRDNGSGWQWVPPKSADPDDTVYSSEDMAWVACCDDNGLRPDADDARREIEEDALSVEVRYGWHVPGADQRDCDKEFRILLCTGGPAVQIRGEIGMHGEPDRAWLECQDWFQPWTRVFNVDQDTLLAYARCFYFGEG